MASVGGGGGCGLVSDGLLGAVGACWWLGVMVGSGVGEVDTLVGDGGLGPR